MLWIYGHYEYLIFLLWELSCHNLQFLDAERVKHARRKYAYLISAIVCQIVCRQCSTRK